MPLATMNVGIAEVCTAVGGFFGAGVGGPAGAAMGGAVGAVIGVALSDKIPRAVSIMSVICGTVVGGALASLTSWKFDIPPELHFFVGVIYGLPGIALAHTIIDLMKNPIATINKFRGKKDA